MGVSDRFRTNDELEKSGIWVKYDEDEFLLARAGGSNRRFAQRFQQLCKPHQRSIDAGTLPPEKGEELLAQAFAETIVLDWRSEDLGKGMIKGLDGKKLSYSVENCKKLLVQLPDFFRILREDAADFALFNQEVREEQGKD